MKLQYPSIEFDDAVAALCHGEASEEQAAALQDLLLSNPEARDEYILRVELHARLGSDPDLFASLEEQGDLLQMPTEGKGSAATSSHSKGRSWLIWSTALAACFLFLAVGIGFWASTRQSPPQVITSNAVAMLDETVDVRWEGRSPHLGDSLEPGLLKLESGLAQVVFYNGARVVLEGPAELELISSNHAICRQGKLTAEVPVQARGFQIDTPQGEVTELGTSFGLEVADTHTVLQVFEGEVMWKTRAEVPEITSLDEGSAVLVDLSGQLTPMPADITSFASMFQIQEKSLALSAQRYDSWRVEGKRLESDPSLLTRFDFDQPSGPSWQLRNSSPLKLFTGDATIVGCNWASGRWPGKQALEFQNVNDRVRMNLPGEYEQLTLSMWVRVYGLDRELNSLFMCDGFELGSLHWLIRNDGVLGLTIVGQKVGDFQIAATEPVLTLDRLGRWMHLAVVVDAVSNKVTHYIDGAIVGENQLQVQPPFRINTAELGNWNPLGFPQSDPSNIRNFSGAMGEFCLFSRALDQREIHKLYTNGKPDPMPSADLALNFPGIR